MPRKGKEKKFDEKLFLSALEQLGSAKGISSDVIVEAISDSFKIAFTKKLEDEDRIFYNSKKVKDNKKLVANKTLKLDDALVRCDIDLKLGKIDLYHQFKVVNDDDIEDDFIEIGLTEAQKIDKNLKVGDFYEVPISIQDFSPSDVNRFKTTFLQKISKAEKDALLETYSNRIGEIVTGTVEKADLHSVIVNLGRTSATLFKNDLIGNETFKPGDQIKVYIESIGKDDKKGNLIKISRSSKGFLKKLFENEVHEIYDQTVIIKDIARKAGVKSKVSVYSNEPNVDASGACIGPNGSRIQAIVSQLGNAKDSKEKIDVITYQPNLGLYLEECLKPGVMIGAKIDYENKEAIVVTQEGTSSLAIGVKGYNVALTRELTGLNKIDVKDESEALRDGIEYTTMEEFRIEAREEEKRKFREESLKHKEIEVKKDYETKNNFEIKGDDEDIDLPELDEEIETVSTEPVNKEIVEEPKEEIVEPIQEEKVKEEIIKPHKEEEPIEKTEVKTTTTLESLEKSLEEEKAKEKTKENYKNKKKKEHKEEKASEEDSYIKKDVKKMDIYTEEELAEIDAELDDEDELDEDYSEYDSDSYYED